LRFPIEYLNNIGKNIIFLPIEKMADYADIITSSKIDEKDNDFILSQLIDFDIKDMYSHINTTSIGNMAYILLNCEVEEVKLFVEKKLNDIFLIEKEKIIEYLNKEI
jgi:hypothetical protein